MIRSITGVFSFLLATFAQEMYEEVTDGPLHPLVRGSSNTVNIADDKEFNDYKGPIYIGTEFVQLYVIYDTMSDWTVVTNGYDTFTSNTSDRWLIEKGNETVP